jgi:hypothetical protein
MPNMPMVSSMFIAKVTFRYTQAQNGLTLKLAVETIINVSLLVIKAQG